MVRDEFEDHRYMLEGLAYRMCGVLADAQDIVQETHIKWCSADRSSIHNPRAWLVTVCSRLAMDLLKSARIRREQYIGTWLPEPFFSLHEPHANPQVMNDSISMALMVAMERLNPIERATFLLHDVFGYEFSEIASILEKSETSCRKSASRARAAVRADRPRFEASPEMHKQLLNAFFEAIHEGNLNHLKNLLTESIAFYSDGGGRVKTATAVLHGRDSVVTFFLEVWRKNVPSRDSIRIENRWFNGSVGALIYQDSKIVAAISMEVDDHKIRRIFAQRNPEKLTVLS